MKTLRFLLPFAFLIAGCGSGVPTPPPDTADNLPPPAEEQPTDEDTTVKEWNASIPPEIPRFRGTITESEGVSLMGQQLWSTTIGATSQGEIEAYINELRAAGWISTDEVSIPRFLDDDQWEAATDRGMFFENPESDLVLVLSVVKGYVSGSIEIASGQNIPEDGAE